MASLASSQTSRQICYSCFADDEETVHAGIVIHHSYAINHNIRLCNVCLLECEIALNNATHICRCQNHLVGHVRITQIKFQWLRYAIIMRPCFHWSINLFFIAWLMYPKRPLSTYNVYIGIRYFRSEKRWKKMTQIVKSSKSSNKVQFYF